MNNSDKEDALTLELLEAIHDRSDITQRHVADRLGVALGLANSYLKRCVRKGLIKIQQAPPNRYLYYLTPKGFAEKSRLTGEFLSSSLDFYRQASLAYNRIFNQCRSLGIEKVCLCGISELAEIATLRAREFEVEIAGIFDPYATVDRFLGIPVTTRFQTSDAFEACVFSALNRPETVYRQLQTSPGNMRLFMPEFLEYITKEN